MKGARLVTVLALASTLGGCMDAGVAWSYAISPNVPESTVLSAAIHEGSCGALGEPPILHFFDRGDLPVLAPRRLAEGLHCFVVEAFDDDCLRRGRGSRAVTLPSTTATVHVDVDVVAGAPAASAECGAYVSSRGAP